MKLVLLVAVSAVVGSILSAKTLEIEWMMKQKTVTDNKTTVGTGLTAGFGALTFGLLNRFL